MLARNLYAKSPCALLYASLTRWFSNFYKAEKKPMYMWQVFHQCLVWSCKNGGQQSMPNLKIFLQLNGHVYWVFCKAFFVQLKKFVYFLFYYSANQIASFSAALPLEFNKFIIQKMLQTFLSLFSASLILAVGVAFASLLCQSCHWHKYWLNLVCRVPFFFFSGVQPGSPPPPPLFCANQNKKNTTAAA